MTARGESAESADSPDSVDSPRDLRRPIGLLH
ncbi:hypothetical protein DF3PA_70013 [Candidatus Defluviicoccus seviourii]|uniref:Uncharacterized protein n=1 Tax=Candidatus Defluviicoccus seviourii TaxID=2565273 RepID=A0A564WGW6_9PROT|nr:hypothetical protein DF3PA_70013 [Candidatus Defluviicoccus seviourii]